MDTNVPVVANGRDTHADESCQISCIAAILEIQLRRTVVLDDRDEVFSEYERYLDYSGEPGVGDEFFRYLYDHRYTGSRVRLVPITRSDDDGRGFEELPRNSLDPSDRKFLALAVTAAAPILNATDSDWEEQRALLDRLSVVVEQLCRVEG